MKKFHFILPLTVTLAACGADGVNPLNDGATNNTSADTGLDLPPGTETTTAASSIERYEAQDGEGSGYAQSVTYDPATNKFYVDNLGFDAANAYSETSNATVQALASPFKVYENDNTVVDDFNGKTVYQFVHRAIYGKSTSGKAEFAVVRTGSYTDYGFGGFVYRRTGGVTLPTEGQAAYSGKYAAVRDFNGKTGLEYATGDMEVAIDFLDFNEGSAVKGNVYNRRVYDENGVDITADIIDGINLDPDGSGGTQASGLIATEIPTLTFKVGPGVIDTSGELTGAIDSKVDVDTGGLQTFESGKYYGILSGANAEELVGVIVVEGDDLRYENVTVRETGGFILYR